MNFKLVLSVFMCFLFCNICISQTEIQNKDNYTINTTNSTQQDTIYLDSLNIKDDTLIIDNTVIIDNAIADSIIINNAITDSLILNNAITDSLILSNAITDSVILNNASDHSVIIDNTINDSIIINNASADTVILSNASDNSINKDSTKKKKLTEPKKAGLLSAAFPSLGQIYNKKYWKIPIVWGGFAATTYFIITNAKPMLQAKEAYIWIDDGRVGEAPNNFAIQYPTTDKLEAIYNQYRSNVELFSLITVVWYALNIVDAVVDGHLKDFDISEDISLNLKPIEMSLMLNPNSNSNNLYTYNYNTIVLNLSFKIR